MKNLEMARAERELGVDGILKILNHTGSLSDAMVKLNMLGYHVSFSTVKFWMVDKKIRKEYVVVGADSPAAEVAHE